MTSTVFGCNSGNHEMQASTTMQPALKTAASNAPPKKETFTKYTSTTINSASHVQQSQVAEGAVGTSAHDKGRAHRQIC